MVELPVSLMNFLQEWGMSGLLLFILVLGHGGFWRWQREYEEMERDRDKWMNLALFGTEIAERFSQRLQKPSSKHRQRSSNRPQEGLE